VATPGSRPGERRAAATRLPSTEPYGRRFYLVSPYRIRNGAGKATLLRALAGLDREVTGELGVTGPVAVAFRLRPGTRSAHAGRQVP